MKFCTTSIRDIKCLEYSSDEITICFDNDLYKFINLDLLQRKTLYSRYLSKPSSFGLTYVRFEHPTIFKTCLKM